MDIRDAVNDFRRAGHIAVVGASRDPAKFGYRVFYHLLRSGFTVYAVNPNCDRIGTNPCYPDLDSLPVKPEAAIFITPPPVTARQATAALERGLDLLWFQPGAVDEATLRSVEEAGARVISGRCALVTL